jgi:hypothetical protein
MAEECAALHAAAEECEPVLHVEQLGAMAFSPDSHLRLGRLLISDVSLQDDGMKA